MVLANEGGWGKQKKGKRAKRYEIDTPLNRVLRAEGVSEEVNRRFVGLRDNMKIVKLTQAIIMLQSELDRAYNKKGGSNGHQNYNRRSFK